MKKMLVLTCALALCVGTTALADHYATKADYHAGKLTPSAPLPKGSGDSCQDILEDLIPPSPYVATADTTGSTNTVDVLPLTCNSNYTIAPGPDDVFMFTVLSGNSLNFLVHPTVDDYDPSIYAVSACGDGSTCGAGWGADSCWARDAVGNPCGATSDENFNFVGAAPGTYYFYVDSFYIPGSPSGRDVGEYEVTVTGNWPVELMEISID
jgi:hypothetical protein